MPPWNLDPTLSRQWLHPIASNTVMVPFTWLRVGNNKLWTTIIRINCSADDRNSGKSEDQLANIVVLRSTSGVRDDERKSGDPSGQYLEHVLVLSIWAPTEMPDAMERRCRQPKLPFKNVDWLMDSSHDLRISY